MEKDPTKETAPQADEAEKASPGETQKGDESSSSQDAPDYDALIDAEKKRGPDPEKAKEAFKKREEKRHEEPKADDDDDLDKPLTRREAQELLERQSHRVNAEAQAERISEIALEFADKGNEKEAALIVEIHKNRAFPPDMPLRDQIREAFYIANGQRLAAKNVEMARKIKSQETASSDTASTHHDAQQGQAPRLATDVAASLKRAGFTYDPSKAAYKKKLPNGKTLFKDVKRNATWVA